MKKSSWAGMVIVGTMAAVLAAILGGRLVRSAPAETGKPQTIAEQAATRPAPDLAALARRAEPAMMGEVAMESFWAILKLRSGGDKKAVPVLTEILVSNAGTGRIHGYAAAQALFCIGGKEAEGALDKHLLELGEYNEQLAGMYVDHWDMAEPKRSEFIEAYLLKSIGREIELAAETKGGNFGAMGFKVTVKNVSAEPVEFLDPLSWRLYVRAKDGRFLVRRAIGMKESKLEFKREANWVALSAGETRTVTESATVKSAEAVRKVDPRLPKEVQLVLQTDVGMFYVDKPGDYEAIIVIEQTPVKGWAAKAKPQHPWVGRAVSKPVAIRLMPPIGSSDR